VVKLAQKLKSHETPFGLKAMEMSNPNQDGCQTSRNSNNHTLHKGASNRL
jgi:hypothetical protein